MAYFCSGDRRRFPHAEPCYSIQICLRKILFADKRKTIIHNNGNTGKPGKKLDAPAKNRVIRMLNHSHQENNSAQKK